MGAWWWGRAHQAPPQIITLPNGERYQFVGATYGTRNVPPCLAAKLVTWLPARAAALARKYFGAQVSQFNEGEDYGIPQFFLWFRRLGNASKRYSYSYCPVRLADRNGVEAGTPGDIDFESRTTWSYACFLVVPRRSRMLQCSFYDFPPNGKGTNSKPVIEMNVPNPFYGRFPQWQPEPIPSVEHSGDLEVELTALNVGESPFPGPVRSSQAEFSIDFHSLGKNDPGWMVHRYELSDATGNKFEEPMYAPYSLVGIYAQPAQTSFSKSFWGTLWPDETAWRLKVTFKRPVGFIPEELVAFTNVPVPAMGTTNKMRVIKTTAGVQVVLTEFVLNPCTVPNPLGGFSVGGWIRFELPSKPEGAALDFWKLKTDAGTAVYDTGNPLDFSYTLYLKSISANTKTVDVTMAVQKTRSVEFLVKPPKAE
jgi:hypothetical protein